MKIIGRKMPYSVVVKVSETRIYEIDDADGVEDAILTAEALATEEYFGMEIEVVDVRED